MNTRSTRGLDGQRNIIPRHRALAKIRFICKVATERRVVSEDGILNERLTRANRLEEFPEVWLQVVVISSVIGHGFESRLFARGRIVLLVPLFNVGTP